MHWRVGLAEAGCDVALVSRTESDLRETAELIERHAGTRTYCYPADVSDREAMTGVFAALKQEAGRLDLLVNNAGMNIRTPALEVTEDEWETIMGTNLKSALFCSQLAGRMMKDAGKGVILNISSVGGHTGLRTGVVYGATKAGMIQMTKNLALEWGRYGIRVNALGPWYFRTPLTEKLLSDEAYLKEILARTPLGRVGELRELVGPAIFLASEAANYITGQTLLVDGGMSIYGF